MTSGTGNRKTRWALLAAAACALVLTTTALAGSGVGGVFNLGQSNTVDGTTSMVRIDVRVWDLTSCDCDGAPGRAWS